MVAAAPRVDLILLTRDAGPIPEAVQAGIHAQRGVQLTVHRVVGAPRPEDAHRWETIVRARNAGKQLGTAPWVMLLDDDVRLAADAVAQLHRGLLANPRYGALAADYLAEAGEAGLVPHVALGATLFRRAVLQGITFRWAAGRCECQCCCDDLRRQGVGIRYWPAARAWHLKEPQGTRHSASGRVLTAFNRRHFDKFRRRFLRSLRAAGNSEVVTAVAYGLYPSERLRLAALPGVEVLALPDDQVLPARRRLRDFQTVVQRWPPDMPVAYWDAGDVYFQGRLAPLWDLTRRYPDRLLAVREPRGHPENRAVAAWTGSIADPVYRQRAFDLLARRPFLNSGFVGGTAQALLAYLRTAEEMYRSPVLAGTTDWGDQTALNLYCHSDPTRWQEIDEGWNYCVHDRAPGEVQVLSSGRVVSRRGHPIHVVHGNAHSLRRLELLWL